MEKTKSYKHQDLETRDGKYVFPLTKPVKYGKDTFEELLLDEPKGKHLRKMPAEPTTGDMLNMAGSLAGEANSLIDELPMKDCTNLAQFIESFS